MYAITASRRDLARLMGVTERFAPYLAAHFGIPMSLMNVDAANMIGYRMEALMRHPLWLGIPRGELMTTPVISTLGSICWQAFCEADAYILLPVSNCDLLIGVGRFMSRHWHDLLAKRPNISVLRYAQWACQAAAKSAGRRDSDISRSIAVGDLDCPYMDLAEDVNFGGYMQAFLDDCDMGARWTPRFVAEDGDARRAFLSWLSGRAKRSCVRRDCAMLM